jgi:threonine dehydratase
MKTQWLLLVKVRSDFKSLPEVDTVVVPVGGGGLISGIATAIKAMNPKCRIIGVQSEKTPGMANLFHKQVYKPEHKSFKTIADGIAVKTPSPIMYEHFISKYVDDMVTVDDNEIAVAIVYLLERAKAVVEGAGAAAIAAGLAGKIRATGKTCFVLSGGNIDLNLISKIIEKGLGFHGRLTNISVVIDDLPGNLHALTQVLAEQNANIVQVSHDRYSEGLFLRETRVDFLLETSGKDHVESIRQAIAKMGGRVL